MDLLATARELAAMAQTGLHFTRDAYDRERYARLAEIAAELQASRSNLAADTLLDWSRADSGYATPKVDVRAFITRDDTVLLTREDADAGRWTLPGGWADVNDTPSAAVEREIEEETGYRAKARRLLAVLDREKQGHRPAFPFHVYKLFFHCEILGGAPRPTAESAESAFFPMDALPELSVSRVLPEQLRTFFAMVQSDAAATRFD